MSDSTAVVEKSVRSVFVGNIPYEATEEKLCNIFSQVGPVISFKLMYDRETGKPKGYGFCEYKDQETALSAMRNLNGHEIAGRPLRVDNACTEKSRMEMQSLMMGPLVESPYGPETEPSNAPEAISNAVASLPPEQMYELMRQMKLCVRNNPVEARTMLMNNPQLAYALLQAQVVMRIVDPKTAVQILHDGHEPNIEPLMPNSDSGTPTSVSASAPSAGSMPNISAAPIMSGNHPLGVPPGSVGGSRMPGPRMPVPSGQLNGVPPHGPGGPIRFPPQPVGPPQQVFPRQQMGGPPGFGGDYDLRQVPANGPGMGGPPRGPVPPPNPADQDMRMPPNMGPPRDSFGQNDFDNRFGREQRGDFDRMGDSRNDQRDPRYRDMRDPPNRDRDHSNYRDDPRERQANVDQDRARDRDRDRDYRSRSYNQDKDFRSGGTQSGSSRSSSASTNIPAGLVGQDQEKANLIMQVLQLSDEQIKLLPPEQQASILQLKEQIQRSQQ